MQCGFATTEGKVERVKTTLPSLPLDLIQGSDHKLRGTMVFGIRASVRPTIRAFIIAEPTEQPTHTKEIAVKETALPHTVDLREGDVSKIVIGPITHS
jgi:hypothetical protein